MWANIAHEFTNVRFYTYTKVNHIFDFSAFESLPNANIVHSILPDNSINYGSLDVMMEKAKELNAPICPYRKGMNAENMPHCGKTCNLCLSSPYVLFIQH